jgi:hypothetical protein
MSPDENKPMAQAVKNSTSDPIIGNYDVLAYKKDESEKYRLCSRFIDHFDADVQTFSLDP